MNEDDSKRVYRIREIRNQLKRITKNQKKDAGNEAAKIRRETQLLKQYHKVRWIWFIGRMKMGVYPP